MCILAACGGIKDAGKVLRNEKISNTDEFLVKKRDPLVLPPDFKEMPQPKTKISKKSNEEKKIKEILKASKEEAPSNKKNSSIEQSIINKIGK